jgi:adenosylmethionine-8-amino-7-oxononanoate aminotransferase
MCPYFDATLSIPPQHKMTTLEPSGTLEVPSKVFHRKLDHKPLFIDRAEGIWLYEAGTGRKIMDGCGGAAVVSVGHCVPEIVEAVSEQLSKLSYISSATFAHQPAEELADLLCTESGMSRALFLTGGSEAMESAIKVSRFWAVLISYVASIMSKMDGLSESTSSLGKSHTMGLL